MKYRIKKRRKAFKQWYILIILVIILISISSSYALWSTRLYVNGIVTGEKTEPKLPVEIPSQGTDTNGVNRYTSNTDLSFLGTEIYRVISEDYQENTITTTIKHMYKQSFSWSSISPTITLTIPNNTGSTFTNGIVELIDSNDTNQIFQNVSTKLSSDTIQAGETANVTITGKLKGNKEVANDTHYNFVIRYNIGEVVYNFYYNIILLPRT